MKRGLDGKRFDVYGGFFVKLFKKVNSVVKKMELPEKEELK